LVGEIVIEVPVNPPVHFKVPCPPSHELAVKIALPPLQTVALEVEIVGFEGFALTTTSVVAVAEQPFASVTVNV
jgi:hypothetical protein